MKIKTMLITTAVASTIAITASASTQSDQLAQMQKQLDQMQAQINQQTSTIAAKKTPIKARRAKMARSSQPSSAGKNYLGKDYWGAENNLLGNSVVLAPYTGQPTFYSGGQLIVNAPSINEDSKLLYRRYLGEMRNGMEKDQPRLVISGKVESSVTYNQPYSGHYTSDINLTGAELDTFAEISQWVNGFMAFVYDDNLGSTNNTIVGTSNRRIDNSRIYLDKGFITVGNFHQSGLYGSAGQMELPFGRYSSSMIASPLTEFVGETKARALTLNYTSDPEHHKITPYIHTFVFNGDTTYGTHPNTIKDYGFDFGSFLGDATLNGDVGVSYLNNIANSNGIQDNGRASGFMGFDQSSASGNSSENIVHRVGGGDLHGAVGYGPWTGVAEYVTALQDFSLADMTYNGHHAKPSALNVEGAYSFKLVGLPSSVALGYGMSREALALNIPYQRYVAAWSVTFMKVIVVTLEGRHDINYAKSDNATGRVNATSTGSAITANQLGKTDNAVTARVGVYF